MGNPNLLLQSVSLLLASSSNRISARIGKTKLANTLCLPAAAVIVTNSASASVKQCLFNVFHRFFRDIYADFIHGLSCSVSLK